jgi:hypothetical protein
MFTLPVMQGDNVKSIKSTFKSPDILAPANIPVAAGKKMAKTEKKLCKVPSLLR